MLSDQFVEIMNICKENNIKISYDQLALLSRIDKITFKGILRDLDECPSKRKSYYLNIMLSKEYLTKSYYLEVLDLILDLEESYLEEFYALLTIPKITQTPYFYDYINIYFIITSTKDSLSDFLVRQEIIKFVPKINGVYDIISAKWHLLEKIHDDYLDVVKEKCYITFEDENDETDDLLDYVNFRYAFFPRSKKLKPMKLERIKSESGKEENKPNNVIKVNFRNDD